MRVEYNPNNGYQDSSIDELSHLIEESMDTLPYEATGTLENVECSLRKVRAKVGALIELLTSKGVLTLEEVNETFLDRNATLRLHD